MLIINALVLKNFTLSLQVYNFGLTPALPEEKSGWTSSGEGGIPENFTLPEKIKLYTFLLIINALVLKNFTVSLQVYNLASPRPFPKKNRDGLPAEREVLPQNSQNKIAQVCIDNQWFSIEKLLTFCAGAQFYGL